MLDRIWLLTRNWSFSILLWSTQGCDFVHAQVTRTIPTYLILDLGYHTKSSSFMTTWLHVRTWNSERAVQWQHMFCMWTEREMCDGICHLQCYERAIVCRDRPGHCKKGQWKPDPTDRPVWYDSHLNPSQESGKVLVRVWRWLTSLLLSKLRTVRKKTRILIAVHLVWDLQLNKQAFIVNHHNFILVYDWMFRWNLLQKNHSYHLCDGKRITLKRNCDEIHRNNRS